LYAIIKSGGRQILVKTGTTISIDHTQHLPGEKIAFEEVLFISGSQGDFIAGSPCVQNARVIGIVTGNEKGEKIRVFRRKRRKGMRRTTGHRTKLTKVRITEIERN